MGHSQQKRDLPKPESCLQTGATQELAKQKLEDAVLEIYSYHLFVHLLCARPSPWGSLNSLVHSEAGVLMYS